MICMNLTMTTSNLEVIEVLEELKESRNVINISLQGDETIYKSFITAINAKYGVLLVDIYEPMVPVKSLKRGARIGVSTTSGGRQIEFKTKFRELFLSNQQFGYQLDVPDKIEGSEELGIYQEIAEGQPG